MDKTKTIACPFCDSTDCIDVPIINEAGKAVEGKSCNNCGFLFEEPEAIKEERNQYGTHFEKDGKPLN